MKKKIPFNMSVLESKPAVTNPGFTAAKIRILYTGNNRNNSHITRESVDTAITTLYNVPIIGEYLEDVNNFGGHGGKLEITDQEIKFVQTTIPYGVVPSDANIYWEEVPDKDGVTRNYLVADGCLLWTGRYPELNTVLTEGKYNQSMEIEVDSGVFAVIDGMETFRIDKFNFTGLCILGVDTENDPDGHVEPCFEGASIMTYGLDKDMFKSNFNEMMEELQFSQKPEGGSPMEEPKKTEITVEEVKAHAEYKLLEAELEKFQKTVEEKTAELDKKEAVFTETMEAKNAELAEKTKQILDFESQVEEKDAALASKTVEFDTKVAEFNAQATELEELRAFKATTETESIKEKFSTQLEADIITSVLEANTDKTVAEIEGLLFAEIGKQNFSQKKPAKDIQHFGVNLEEPVTPNPTQGAYNGLFDIHGANKQ